MGRAVALVCGIAGIAAVIASYLPWVEYDRGGGNGVLRFSGLQGGQIGGLTAVLGVVLAVAAILAAVTADRHRGLVTAIPALLGVMATLAALVRPVDVGGAGTLRATAVGVRIEAGTFLAALILSIGLSWLDAKRSPEPPSHA